ncbi:MAG TPA: hypothetical protein VK742_09050 [Candidatus Sulfotelmatobacter sp.]|jgi:hypothetical protein|nr:hypothetical protein [Candidatus Sulfotelmatobacter sp.]
MTDPELNKILGAAREPALDSEYIEDFPRQVMAGLSTKADRPGRPAAGFFPGWAWGLAVALCVMTAIPVWLSVERKKNDSPVEVLADAKLIRETMAMFPNQLRAIVRDQNGIKLELAEQADVPGSPPLLVRVCDGKACASFITFSGQEILLGDKKYTVLSGDDGGIILETEKFVWSSKTGGLGDKRMKISARVLDI